jgi:hypothetical protein
MIGYSIISGGEMAVKNFKPYIWNELGVGDFIRDKFNDFQTEGLKLILIMYYVDGKFSANGPLDFKVNNYSPKDQSISVAHTIPVRFWDMSEAERKQYISDSTLHAYVLAKERLIKKKLGIDFENLQNKLEANLKEWSTKKPST